MAGGALGGLGDKMKQGMANIKSAVTGEPVQIVVQEETMTQRMLREMDTATTMSWKQRATGFGICFGVGLLLSFLSLPLLWTLQLTKFAIIYTIGSILSLMSTMFLMGPVKQCKNMFDGGRFIATFVYLASIAATLAVAFTIGNVILVLIFVIIQFIAMIWYCMTYIPGGQGFLKALIFR